MTDVPVTGENEFRIVSELSRELIVAWPLFMKRIKAKRLVCLVTISQHGVCVCVCKMVLLSLAAGAATPGQLEKEKEGRGM